MSNATITPVGNQPKSTVFIIWASVISDIITQPTNWIEKEELDVSSENSLLNDDNPFSSTNYIANVNKSFHYKYHNISGDSFENGPIVWSGYKIGFFLASLIIMTETVIGNLLVVLSVLLEKKLQTPFNFYIVNLALTDLNVGLSVMTLFIVYNLYEYFPFDAKTCSYWIWSDYTMTFESVVTLAAISLDRLWSVTWSLHYRNNNSGRKSFLIIIFTWIYVNVMWLPAFITDRQNNVDKVGECGWKPQENLHSVFYVGVLGYYLPLTIMLAAYLRIFYVMKKRLSQISHTKREALTTVTVSQYIDHGTTHSSRLTAKESVKVTKSNHDISRARREKKAFYTLGHIVLFFLICWIPFYLYFLINPVYPTFFPSWYGEFCYWMAYLNSAVNPLVYGIGNEEFKKAFKKILLCNRCRT